MNALSRTGLILTVLACSVAVSCGKSQTAPSLATVDPATVLFADDFDTENNRQGKYYRLTAAGHRAVGSETMNWRRYVEAVELILGTS